MEQNIISLSKTLPLENKTNVINNSSVIEYLNNHQHMAEMMAEYKSLFDNVTDSMLLVKPTGEIISVNTAACKEYGYTTEEFLKLSICDLNSPADQLNSNDRFEKIANLGSLIF